ncbi:MAG: hypothetical protein V5783_04075 [Pontiella sp.]
MFKKITTILLYTAAICLLSSCQMRTPKQQAWVNPAFKDHTLGKTMVLGMGNSQALSRQYEAYFVNSLLPYIDAGSLRVSMVIKDKIDKEELELFLEQKQVKTIIVTRVLEGTSRDQIVSIGYDISPYNNGYWGYYNHGYTLQANTATVTSYMEYVLETNIYDVESEALIWSGRKSIFDDRSDLANMEIIIKAVVKDLHHQNMLNQD